MNSSSDSSLDFFDNGLVAFPRDVLNVIFLKLSIPSLLACWVVCKRFRQVASADDLWRVRLELDYDLAKADFQTPQARAWELYRSIASQKPIVVNKIIEMKYCDGGDYSEYYAAHRFFTNGSYCSNKVNRNITIIAKVACVTWFHRIEIQSPGAFYSAPLRDVLVFICKNEPKVEDFMQFNDFTSAQAASWLSTTEDFRIAMAEFNMDRQRRVQEISKSGSWIVIKLLRSGGDQVNIDAGNIVVYGIPLDSSQKTLLEEQSPRGSGRPSMYIWPESDELRTDE